MSRKPRPLPPHKRPGTNGTNGRGTTGAPGFLSSDVRARLLNALTMPHTLEDAATLAGISPSTLHKWLAKGRAAKDGQYYELVQAVELARAECKQLLISRVMKATKKDPDLALKVLARRYPREWGPSAIHQAPAELTPDLAQVRGRIAARLAEIEGRLGLAANLLGTVGSRAAENSPGSPPNEMAGGPLSPLRRIAAIALTPNDAANDAQG